MASKHPKNRPVVSSPQQSPASDAAGSVAAKSSTHIGGIDTRYLLAAILVLAGILRLLYLVSIQDSPDYNLPTADAAYKDFWARAILTGNATPSPGQPDPQLATTPYVRPPTYPFFMALVYLLTGYSYTALRVIQMALGILSCWLFYRLGRRVFSEGIALFATLLMSTYWIFIFFEGEMNSPPIIVCLVLAILNLMLDWADSPRLKSLAWVGLFFGVLVLDRPETLLFLPVLLLWAWWFAPPSLELKSRLLHLAVVPAVVALCIAPVTLRNYIRSGEPVLICTIGGLNFYAGNNPEATGYFPNLNYGALFGVSQGLSHHNFPQLVQALERKTGQTGLTHSDLQSYFTSEALRFIRENPGQAIGLALKKAAYFWGPSEISSDKVFELEKTNSPILRFLPPFAVFMPLAVVGLVLLLATPWMPRFGAGLQPNARRALMLIAAFVLTSFFTHLIFFVVARFRVPVIPFVLLFSAFALAHLVQFLRQRDSAMLGLWGGIAIAAAIVFSVPWVPYRADAILYHYQRALAYGHQGNTADAIRELKLAVNEGGGQSADVCSELGFGLTLQGETYNAVYWYDKALEADPNHVLSLHRKGDVLLAQGEYADAANAYRAAVASDFTNVPARMGLVRALVRHEAFAEAQVVADETTKLGVSDYDAKLMLGELEGYQGRHAEAVAHLSEALAIRPEDADLHNLLGMQYAALGKYEEAIASYRRAIELRPGFSLAFTNLGNLYAHLKEYDNAIIQYTEALTANLLDPGAEYGWGFVNAQRGEFDKAIERMKLAVEKRPNYTEAHNYLGFLYMQQGKLDEARFHLERAARLNPRYLAARNNLGDLYLALNLFPEAEAEFNAVLQIQPGEPYATAQLPKASQGRVKQQVQANPNDKVLVFPGS